MAVDAQSLYLQLRQLVAEAPSDLAAEGPISAETHHWLGRAFALITAGRSDKFDTLERMDEIAFRSAADSLTNPLLRAHHAHEIIAILHRALARAELNAPAAARGGFIAVGAAFDAVQTVGKVLREA